MILVITHWKIETDFFLPERQSYPNQTDVLWQACFLALSGIACLFAGDALFE